MLSKERKLEIYTERLHRLAFDIAMQSCQGGKELHGMAIVAEETRNLSNRLFAMLERESIETIPAVISSALIQIEYLSLNGMLETMRVAHFNNHITPFMYPSAAIMDEIKNTTRDIRNLFDMESESNILPQPELKNESRVSDAKIFLIQATIGGEAFVENAAFVEEVHTYLDGDPLFGIQDGYYQVRNAKIPVIDCYAKLNLDRSFIKTTDDGQSCAIILNTAWAKESTRYAVLVDSLPQTFGFYSRFSEGESTASRSKVFTSPHVRACWDTVDDGQMIFLDWKSMA